MITFYELTICVHLMVLHNVVMTLCNYNIFLISNVYVVSKCVCTNLAGKLAMN